VGAAREIGREGRIGCPNVPTFISCGYCRFQGQVSVRNSVNDPFVREVTFEILITVSSTTVPPSERWRKTRGLINR